MDQFHRQIERSRRDLGIDFYDESSDLVKNNQDNDFNENKLIILDSVAVNTGPISDSELAYKKYIDDELHKNTVLRFNQTLENDLKVSVGNDSYNLTKDNRTQITDTTKFNYPNNGGYLLQNRLLKCNGKGIKGKVPNFLKSTKTNSPTGYSGAVSKHGPNVFVSFERTDIIQISNITFYYNRF